MLAIVWTYDVKPEHAADFERTYASDGDWAVLFSRSAGFLGVELFRGAAGTYLTIDRWRSEGDFEAFLTDHRAAYDALDRSTEGWTNAEQLIGRFSPHQLEGARASM